MVHGNIHKRWVLHTPSLDYYAITFMHSTELQLHRRRVLRKYISYFAACSVPERARLHAKQCAHELNRPRPLCRDML